MLYRDTTAMNNHKFIFKLHKMCKMSQRLKSETKCVRPVLSTDLHEARIRALGLYRAFYRYIPYIMKYSDIQKNEEDCRWMIREYFYKHANITDVRVIDILIMKGFMELKEIKYNWQQKHHVIRHWKPADEPKCTTFLGKFISGVD